MRTPRAHRMHMHHRNMLVLLSAITPPMKLPIRNPVVLIVVEKAILLLGLCRSLMCSTSISCTVISDIADSMLAVVDARLDMLVATQIKAQIVICKSMSLLVMYCIWLRALSMNLLMRIDMIIFALYGAMKMKSRHSIVLRL